ncbi:MAG: adenylate kinase [Alphaproteobacteria bacterium]|nr:adenylate kinase [Alphaproteobacteria bacterium]
MLELKQLGHRICIIGPSHSGKSMLTHMLGQKTSFPVFHLDQFAHEPYTKWKRRSDQDFRIDHEKIISGESWIMDGEYSAFMRQRFERTTAVIWLDFPFFWGISRYLWRRLRRIPKKFGNLEGGVSVFSPWLVKYMLFGYRKIRPKSKMIINESKVLLLRIRSVGELNRYYRHWGLGA